ncbi:TPA: hypothetical protein QCY05_000860 [Bacillus wiedmannii]|nr:hypothetical protein [Bacillus wiedmannii]
MIDVVRYFIERFARQTGKQITIDDIGYETVWFDSKDEIDKDVIPADDTTTFRSYCCVICYFYR